MSQQGTTKQLSIEKILGLNSPSDFDLAPDGRQVAYCFDCGGQRQLFVAPLYGGWPQRLTLPRQDCSEPRFAPDSASIVFIRDSSLWLITTDGTAERRLLRGKGGLRLPRWSPDGTQIALYARLRGWYQIWLQGIDGSPPRLLTPEPGDYDYLAWSPDGTQIAFCRQRADLHGRELWLVDAQSGEPRRLGDEQPAFLDAPTWTPDGRQLLFVSDADGWPHLWAIDLAHGSQRQLTFGPCEDGQTGGGEATRPLVAPDGRLVAFVRNREACLDLVVMPLAGGEPRRLSQGDGVASIVGWLPDSSGLLATFESPQAPLDLWRLALDGTTEQLTHSLGGGIDPAELPAASRVSWQSDDELLIHGTLYLPQTPKGTRCPAIVYPHGGPTWQHLRGWMPFVALLVQEGYAVLAPDFRGSTGYGTAFRDANFGVWGVKDTADVVAAARYLRTRDDIDGSRIGVFGGSYGGYMVLCALTMHPDAFACGVDLFGDSEIALSFRHGDRDGRHDLQRMMGLPEDNVEAYRRGSPLYHAEQVQAPLLILHGRDDMRVVPLMSEKMIEALKIEGKLFEAHFYEGEGHGFDKPENRRDVYRRVLKFLATYLRGDDDAED